MATDLELAYAYLVEKQERYNLYWNYYSGEHPLVYNASKLRDVFGDLDATFSENWCNVAVDTVVDRVNIERFQIGTDSLNPLGDELLQLWRITGLDLDSQDAHLCALVTGEAFVVCGQTEDGEPEAYYNDSRLCHMIYDEARPRIPRFAAKWWEETVLGSTDKGITHLTLYYPDRFEYYVANRKRAELSSAAAFQPDIERATEPNPYGVIPVFHLRREQRAIVSELTNIVPLQAQLNKILADMMIAAEFGAFRQRYIISQMVGGQKFRNAPNEIWSLPASDGEGQPTTVGEFEATDLGNYLAAIERSAATIATIASIPKHLLNATGNTPSGAALRALEAPLVKKAERYMRRWESVWRHVAQWLIAVTGGGMIDANDIDVIWTEAGTNDPETDATTAETLVRAGMPLTTALRRQGWSDAEIEQMEKDQQADDARNATLSEAYMAAAESNANRQAAEAPANNGTERNAV